MAKYNVTRSCGHDEIVNLVGKHSQREWRLENVEPSKLCYECYQQKLAEDRERENREAAEAAKDMNLPALAGTEKQVAWAETIRQQLLADLDTFIYKTTRGETNIVVELVQQDWTDEQIGKHLGMDADEVLRLKQVSGIAELFRGREYSRSWVQEGQTK